MFKKKNSSKAVKYDFWGRGWKVRNGTGKTKLVREYENLPKWAQNRLVRDKSNGEGVPHTWTYKASTAVTALELGSIGYSGAFAPQLLAPLAAILGITFGVDAALAHGTVKCAENYGYVPNGPVPEPEEEPVPEAEETGYLAIKPQEAEQNWREEIIHPTPPEKYLEEGFGIDTVDSRGSGNFQKTHSG